MINILQVRLNHFDVADGEVSYEVELGQNLIYPVEIEVPDSYPTSSASNQYDIRQIKETQYSLKGQVIEVFHTSQVAAKYGLFIFHVKPFYFIGRIPSEWSTIQIDDWLHIYGQLRLNGWDFGPRRRIISDSENNILFSKNYSPHNNSSNDIYQLYKVTSIQRFQKVHNTSNFAPSEHVQKTDIQQKILNDDGNYVPFLLTLEYQNENGLEAVNRILNTGKELDIHLWNLA